jgi:hypothetical protein
MTTAKPKFIITDEMKRAAKTVFKTMAFTRIIRPIVEGYQQKILDEIKPKDVYKNEVITNPKYSYQMNDADFSVYLRRCNEERIKAKLHVENEEFCPLLVAEDLQRQAERAFVETMEPITHLTADKVLCSKNGLENYAKLIDLSLRLVAPYVDKKL